jgi:predicted phage terminase large subunit-like protein
MWGPDTPLAPEIATYDELIAIRDNVRGGKIRFENIYMGNPTVQAGTILQRAWWREMPQNTMPRKEDCQVLIQVWDTAFKKSADSAFSVCLTMGLWQGSIFVFNMYRKKVEFPELLKVSRELYKIDKPRLVIIEDKASGQSLIQSLQSGTGVEDPSDKSLITLPVMPMKADSDPVAYVTAFAGFLEAGRCWLPEGAFWVEDFKNENSAFPNGAYKDVPLTWAHGMKYLTAGDQFSRLSEGEIVSAPPMVGEAHLGDWSDLPGVDGLKDFLSEFRDL